MTIMLEGKPSLESLTEVTHFGVKGMHWGVRKSNETSSDSQRRAKRKKTVIIAGSVVAVVVVAAGTAYILHQRKNGNLRQTVSQVSKLNQTKKIATALHAEPKSLVYAARTKRNGYGFPKRGGLSDPTMEFIKAGLTGHDGSTFFSRYGSRNEKVATMFLDPLKRTDQSGRIIQHSVIIPESLSNGINSIEDAFNTAWPLIKDDFAAIYDAPARHGP